jgi:hypothetical protein
MPKENPATVHWTLEAVAKVLESLGAKDLILQGIKSVGSKGKARKIGFAFHNRLSRLELDLNIYLEALEHYLKSCSVSKIKYSGGPRLLERARYQLWHVLWQYGQLVDTVKEVHQLGVYFPEIYDLESDRVHRLTQTDMLPESFTSREKMEVDKLKARLPIIKKDINHIHELAKQVREVLNKEWNFGEAF